MVIQEESLEEGRALEVEDVVSRGVRTSRRTSRDERCESSNGVEYPSFEVNFTGGAREERGDVHVGVGVDPSSLVSREIGGEVLGGDFADVGVHEGGSTTIGGELKHGVAENGGSRGCANANVEREAGDATEARPGRHHCQIQEFLVAPS